MFSIPEPQRELRRQTRTRLSWLGFAKLYDGTWISPQDKAESVSSVFSRLQVSQWTAVTTTDAVVGNVPFVAAWDLTAIAAFYRGFIDENQTIRQSLACKRLDDVSALVARTELMDVWRALPAIDPSLPTDILPADWPRKQARVAFLRNYNALGPLAELGVRQMIESYDPVRARLVKHHNTREIDHIIAAILSDDHTFKEVIRIDPKADWRDFGL